MALELYRRDRGAYPDALEALAPAYLNAIPTDAFSGHPFAYRLLDKEYWLYSLGANRRDDTHKWLKIHRRKDLVIHAPESAFKR